MSWWSDLLGKLRMGSPGALEAEGVIEEPKEVVVRASQTHDVPSNGGPLGNWRNHAVGRQASGTLFRTLARFKIPEPPAGYRYSEAILRIRIGVVMNDLIGVIGIASSYTFEGADFPPTKEVGVIAKPSVGDFLTKIAVPKPGDLILSFRSTNEVLIGRWFGIENGQVFLLLKLAKAEEPVVGEGSGETGEVVGSGAGYQGMLDDDGEWNAMARIAELELELSLAHSALETVEKERDALREKIHAAINLLES